MLPAFLCLVQGMQLSLYRNGQHLMDFMAYLVARNAVSGVLAQHISVAKKVLHFCDTKEAWPHTEELVKCYNR